MIFISREDAGRTLGTELVRQGIEADLVLGLPRGGVVVAAEVASMMHLPLDVLIVRKIGHPWHREFAIGALAEGDVISLDQRSIGEGTGVRAELEQVIAEEQQRLREYKSRFRRAMPIARSEKSVIIVDDGLATGATTEVAIRAVRSQGARRVIVAAPVGSANAVERLREAADELIVLISDPHFEAVSSIYETFPQTRDEEVVELLSKNELRH